MPAVATETAEVRALTTLLSVALPERHFRVKGLLEGQGITNRSFCLQEGEAEYVARCVFGSESAWNYQCYRKEQLFMQVAAEAIANADSDVRGVTIPRVEAVVRDEQNALMLVQMLPGRDGRHVEGKAETRARLWDDLGKANRLLNETCAGDKFGSELAGPEYSELRPGSFREWVQEQLRAMLFEDRLQRWGVLSGPEIANVQRRFAELEHYPAPWPPRLVHGNISPANCIARADGQLVGLLDFGDSGALIPEVDIAENQLWCDEHARKHFERGYGPHFADTFVVECMMLRRLLQSITYGALGRENAPQQLDPGVARALERVRPLLS